eukprot:TRINITY_DN5532_c0_g3_i2.p2 TRINITY_DN5532_c0_g3~~TRINITY_DN5532_c0_g3_i2.p2  ORF type:complete len:545 (-),score=73.61 TRINITY_DN5532_c0_g3_i2:303-1937(-)
MSKRKKNYPDPTLIIDKYGADALRLYLINSPVVRAENLRFSEGGVQGVVKDVFLPWYNAYRFLVQNAKRWEDEYGKQFQPLEVDLKQVNNVLDRWINAAARSLVNFVRTEMEGYRLYTVVPSLVSFIDQLTNMYVRYNRTRLKGKNGEKDTEMALATLFDVLLKISITMAPFTPFFTESMFQNMRLCMGPSAPLSVHFCEIPAMQPEEEGDKHIQVSVERMQRVIDLARTIRERRNVPLKFPLKNLIVVHTDQEFLEDMEGELRQYVVEELNVRNLTTCRDPMKYASLRAEPNWQVLAKRLNKDTNAVAAAVKKLDQADIIAFERDGSIELAGHKLSSNDIVIKREFKIPENRSLDDIDANGDGEVLAVLDLTVDTELIEAGIAREIVNRFQKLRKKAGLTVADVVEMYYAAADSESEQLITKVLSTQKQYLVKTMNQRVMKASVKQAHSLVIAEEETEVGNDSLKCGFKAILVKPAVWFDEQALRRVCNGDRDLAQGIQIYLASREMDNIKEEVQEDGSLCVQLMGQKVNLKVGEHIFWSPAA